MMKFLLAMALILNIGCEEDEDEKYSVANVEFTNSAGASLATTTAPSEFGVRLVYIQINDNEEGVYDNPSLAGRIWGSTTCAPSSVGENGTVVYSDPLSDEDCEAAGIEYFDLNRSSEEVNAELNSQNAQIVPGTYRQISLALLGSQQGGNSTYENVNWAYADRDVTTRNIVGVQSEWFAQLSEPIEVGEDEAVTFTISYNLANIVTLDPEDPQIRTAITQPGSFDDCSDDDSTCINIPSLTLTVTKTAR